MEILSEEWWFEIGGWEGGEGGEGGAVDVSKIREWWF